MCSLRFAIEENTIIKAYVGFHFNIVAITCRRVQVQISARIYRSSFGRENDRFRENKQETPVFNLIRTQRRLSQLVLD
jgi:hypothetical protein